MLANIVYTAECYFCDTFFDDDPGCANMFLDDPHPCHELYKAYLCEKCHDSEELVSHLYQCSGCGQHTCHDLIHTMDYLNCWERNISIYNIYLKDCTV
jgi:hypothetical protein